MSQSLPFYFDTQAERATASPEVKLTLKELCNAAGVSERTVRYYIQQGLLPPPEGAGPASRYSLEHLSRLALIRRLKAALLPLNEIKQLMVGKTTEQLSEVANEFHAHLAETNPVAPSERLKPVRQSNLIPAAFKALPQLEVFIPPEPETEKVQVAPSPPQPDFKSGGKWQRIVLTAGLELHYEDGGTQDNEVGREKLGRLLEFARQLYSNP